MSSHPVQLGTRTFKSKSEAKTYISEEILHGYGVGEPITSIEHIEILEDIVSRKDDKSHKVGPGIDYFYVGLKKDFGRYVPPDDLTLAIRQTDGQTMDFGYSKVVEGTGVEGFVKDALRHEIVDLRDRFKFPLFDKGSVYCSKTGEKLDAPDQAEVRYENPSWGDLTQDFATSEGGWASIGTHSGHGPDGQIGRLLESDTVRVRWREYYAAHAKPVIVKKR